MNQLHCAICTYELNSNYLKGLFHGRCTVRRYVNSILLIDKKNIYEQVNTFIYC